MNKNIVEKQDIISTGDLPIRDPFIVASRAEDGYLMYAQTGNRGKAVADGVEVYKSLNLFSWTPEGTVAVAGRDFTGHQPYWAPEIHCVDNAWYMFLTCQRKVGDTGIRGTLILRSDNPRGPFLDFGENPQTPPLEQSLDGTFWQDRGGQRWLVYCHEWLQIGDGAVKAIRLRADMTRTEGESITLFHASEAPWVHSLGGELKRPGTAGNFVTDGPFLRRAMNGDLLIIWSSFRKGGNYAIGLARARSGEVIGPWTQDTEPLFGDNGGHAMIFSQGSDLLLALHQPNGDSLERLKLFHLLETVEGFRLGHPYRPDSDSIKSKMEVC